MFPCLMGLKCDTPSVPALGCLLGMMAHLQGAGGQQRGLFQYFCFSVVLLVAFSLGLCGVGREVCLYSQATI